MSFESKLMKILKWEIISFLIMLLLTIMLIPFIHQFSKTHDTVNKFFSIIIIIIILFILFGVLVNKIIIILKIIWSKRNYEQNPNKVYGFLKKRRASLITIHGHISYYQLYSDVIKNI